MSPSAFDPAFWHSRAAEARSDAAQMSDPLSRRVMIALAARYERLAHRATMKRDIFGHPELTAERSGFVEL